MKPIWIVDDDQSIRFVLEKALMREDLPTRSFTNAREVITALDAANDEDGPRSPPHPPSPRMNSPERLVKSGRPSATRLADDSTTTSAPEPLS